MATFGLIGRSLSHSFSKDFFSQYEPFMKGGHEYVNFELKTIAKLPDKVLSNSILKGFNVTIPYKEEIIPYLDGLSPEAKQIGAVNCVVKSGEKWVGHNTDWIGFKKSLEEWLAPIPQQAFVLGSGGASKAVIFALERLGVEYQIVSRDPAKGKSYTSLAIPRQALIINCTPLGTFPKVEEAPPLPYDQLEEGHSLFDLVYNPRVSTFLQQGIERACNTINGQRMLEIQAEESWKLWVSS